MDLSNFLAVAAGLLDGFIALARLKDPTATDADIAAEVSGDLKHLLRTKLGAEGFFVDLFWSLLEPDIDKLITGRLKVEAVDDPTGTSDAAFIASPQKEVTA